MKIIDKTNKKCKFKTLFVGEIFLYTFNNSKSILMKIDKVMNESEDYFTTVNLCTGQLYTVNENEEVDVVKATLTIE